jgi:hypothetical protein
MNLQKLMLIALLGAAVSATTMPTIDKVIGFGHTQPLSPQTTTPKATTTIKAKIWAKTDNKDLN